MGGKRVQVRQHGGEEGACKSRLKMAEAQWCGARESACRGRLGAVWAIWCGVGGFEVALVRWHGQDGVGKMVQGSFGCVPAQAQDTGHG